MLIYCTQCGQELPHDAKFCFSCGAPVPREARGAEDEQPTANTTAAFEIGALDPVADVGHVPDLPPGSGMLVVVRGPNAGSRYLLDRPLTTIGRHPDSHVFLDDVTVSRHHCEVHNTGTGLSVTDLGSLNGTYVAGERVETSELVHGGELQVGRFKLLVLLAPAADDATAGQ